MSTRRDDCHQKNASELSQWEKWRSYFKKREMEKGKYRNSALFLWAWFFFEEQITLAWSSSVVTRAYQPRAFLNLKSSSWISANLVTAWQLLSSCATWMNSTVQLVNWKEACFLSRCCNADWRTGVLLGAKDLPTKRCYVLVSTIMQLKESDGQRNNNHVHLRCFT